MSFYDESFLDRYDKPSCKCISSHIFNIVYDLLKANEHVFTSSWDNYYVTVEMAVSLVKETKKKQMKFMEWVSDNLHKEHFTSLPFLQNTH